MLRVLFPLRRALMFLSASWACYGETSLSSQVEPLVNEADIIQVGVWNAKTRGVWASTHLLHCLPTSSRLRHMHFFPRTEPKRTHSQLPYWIFYWCACFFPSLHRNSFLSHHMAVQSSSAQPSDIIAPLNLKYQWCGWLIGQLPLFPIKRMSWVIGNHAVQMLMCFQQVLTNFEVWERFVVC